MSDIKFSQDGIIKAPAAPQMIAVDHRDWVRLRRSVSNIIDRKQVYQNCAFLLFGVAGSAGLTLIGVYYTEHLPAWVRPTLWAIIIASFILGGFFLFLDADQKKMATNSLQTVLDELDALEKASGINGVNNLQQP